MTPKTRRACIAKIHVAVQQLGMDDAAYRAMLTNVGGARPPAGQQPSSTQLTDAGINAVIRRLEELGFRPIRPAPAGRKPRMTAERQAMLDKIDAYLAEANKPMAYADGIARQMFRIDLVAWCSEVQLRAIIAALHRAAKKAGRATE